MDEGDDDTEDDIPLKKFAASAETPSNREQERVSKTQTNKSYSSPAKVIFYKILIWAPLIFHFE